MNKTIRLLMIVAVAGLSFTACKSKQKMTAVPGASVPATTTTTTSSTVTPTTPPPAPVAPVTPAQPEATRSESFKLATGETNASALNMKYHVVVGSFSVHDNARNLRNRLVNEGNNALTVENDRGMLRVIIASYNEYSQARTKINEIRSTYSDAWVLVQR